MQYIIDAKGRTLGRVASEAAVLLRGKATPDFERHIAPKAKVSIINAKALRIDPKKLTQKKYVTYSGYPGGIKRTPLGMAVTKKGTGFALRTAILRMIPRTKLRPGIMKNLSITD